MSSKHSQLPNVLSPPGGEATRASFVARCHLLHRSHSVWQHSKVQRPQRRYHLVQHHPGLAASLRRNAWMTQHACANVLPLLLGCSSACVSSSSRPGLINLHQATGILSELVGAISFVPASQALEIAPAPQVFPDIWEVVGRLLVAAHHHQLD